MPVSFNNFPANWRMPLYWVEVDPSKAGLPINNQPALMVGQMFTASGAGGRVAGTAAVGVALPIGSLAQAKAAFGEGSMIERMFARFFDNSFGQLVYGMPLAEPSAGAIATGTITVTHAPSDAGTFMLYIAAQLVEVGVAATDDVSTVATNIVAAINDLTTLPVSAAIGVSGGGHIALTAKWKGLLGNEITLRDNFYGTIGGEVMPPSMTVSYSNPSFGGGSLAGGSAAPDMSSGIVNIVDEQFDYVAMPFTDTTSLNAWEAEYGFGDTGRWGWMRQLFGVIFS